MTIRSLVATAALGLLLTGCGQGQEIDAPGPLQLQDNTGAPNMTPMDPSDIETTKQELNCRGLLRKCISGPDPRSFECDSWVVFC